MRRFAWALLPAMILPLAACDDGGTSGLVVARAAGHELTVGETVRLIAPENNLPAQRQVVEAVADLWIDYTLLAEAAAGDTTLGSIDFAPLVRQQEEAQMIVALRDSMIQADTVISDEELRRRFAQEAPGSSVRARHILLAWPEQATDEQRDSVRAQAESLLERVHGGADFAELARQYSQDPGSAAQGGDLGFFGRGDMVRPFEEAAFALEPGETSDVVESPYGLHIIRVEEKETPDMEAVGPQFRQMLVQQRRFQAESTYVAGIEAGAAPTAVDDAVEVVRQLARNPTTRLRGRAAERPLVRYEGGALTASEVREFMQTRPPQYRAQVAAANDEQLREGILMALAQRELLLAEAERQGLGFSGEDRDSVVTRARTAFRDAARQLGLLGIEPEAGQTVDEAVEARVESLLQAILQGRQDVIPLGAVSYTLRQQYDAEVNAPAVDRALAQLEEVRGPAAGAGQAPPQGAPPQPQPQPQPSQPAPTPPPADTTGGA